MTEEKKEEEQLSPYEEMVKERLELLREGLDNFPMDEGEDPNSRLPGFEDLQDAPVPEEQEKEAADRAALKETRKKLQQCKDQLARELDRAPSNEELAKEMGVELELVESLVAV